MKRNIVFVLLMACLMAAMPVRAQLVIEITSGSDQLLPIGGFFIALFVGWKLDKNIVDHELSNEGKLKIAYLQVYRFTLKFIAPLAIAFVFLATIFGLFS